MIQAGILAVIFVSLTYLLVREKTKTRNTIVDTSALIDGRISILREAGFLNEDLVVPKQVLEELDQFKRHRDKKINTKAKTGKETYRKLQSLPGMVIQRDYSKLMIEEVDDLLIKVCERTKSRLITTDSELLKRAESRGVVVLSIDNLLVQLRSSLTPGDQIKVKITKRGKAKNQGVGYTKDGTMVVVSRAGSLIGKVVTVEIVKLLQSDTGRTIIATKR